MRSFFLFLGLLVFGLNFANAQKFGYIDSDFILSKMPDYKKAQDEIPFTIIMPTYLPYSQQDESIADIQGPLKEYQGDEIETKVKIGNRGIRENLLYF